MAEQQQSRVELVQSLRIARAFPTPASEGVVMLSGDLHLYGLSVADGRLAGGVYFHRRVWVSHSRTVH